MRFGPAGYPQRSKDAQDALNIIKGMGLDALEMEFVRGARISEERAVDIGNMARERNIRLSAHAPYFVSFNSETPETREKSISWVMDTVRAAHNMGAYIIVIHAASYGKEKDKATDSVIAGLTRCREIMDDERIDDVILGLETMGRPATWGTLKEISEVMDAVPGTRPVLDVAHVHARKNGCLRTKDDFLALIDEFLPLAGSRPHFHISCIEFTAKGERMHLPLSAKDPDMSILADVLDERSEDCTFICESPLLEEDAVVFRNMFPRFGRP
ncbi:MAG: TIM barrel protein [Methanomassiliicoccaceae archaeon]|nr:TIM barrel protein [Methanomassiliicoccaceae archaeon]